MNTVDNSHIDLCFHSLTVHKQPTKMDEQDFKSLILYYGREKYYNSMQSKSLEAITKFPANPCFRLYNGFGLCLGNRIQEGNISNSGKFDVCFENYFDELN